MPLLDEVQREVLGRLGRLSVTARQAVEGALAGRHRSLRRGLSVEFAGHRPYQPGDDLRRLDWAVWARSDRYEVREYEEETRLRATLVLDASGSMAWGGKMAWARALAAALAVLMVRARDQVGLAVVDAAVRTALPPSSAEPALLRLIDAIDEAKPAGPTGIGPALEAVAGRLTRRGLVIAVTDALCDPADLARGLAHLRHRRQEVRLFVVRDPAEEDFPFAGALAVHGLEGEARLRIDAERVRAAYRAVARGHRRDLARACADNGCPLHWCSCRDDLALVLASVLGGEEDGGR